MSDSTDDQQRADEAAAIARSLGAIAEALEKEGHPTHILREEETRNQGIARLWGGGK